MTDWSRAYTAEWHLYRVNRETWADADEAGRLVSFSLTRTCDGEAPEIDSGSIQIDGDPSDEFEPGYYRIAMRAIQEGAERVDVATLLCESDGGSIDYGADSKGIVGRSVLHPAATAAVVSGDYVVAGQDGAQKAAEMLRACINAPISVDGSFALESHYDFQIGAKVLDCVWDLLDAGGFCMYPDGRGTVHIAPLPSGPALDLDRANAKLLEPSVSYALDYSEVPNRFTARLDGLSAQAVNDTASSPASYQTRGYWIDDYDDSPVLLQGETLQAYAERKLSELSVVRDSRTYTRKWQPNVHPFSLVRGSMPSVRLDGDLRISMQSIDCSYGLEVTETAAKEVQAWR